MENGLRVKNSTYKIDENFEKQLENVRDLVGGPCQVLVIGEKSEGKFYFGSSEPCLDSDAGCPGLRQH